MEKVLVVDDDTSIRKLVELYLKNEGYSVDSADNGEEALRLVKDNDYDLIILDVMMPKMDGVGACMKR